MLKILTYVFAVVGVLATLGVTGGFIYHRYHGHEFRGEWIVKRISGKLDLSEEQTAKLRDVFDSVQALRQDKFKSHEQTLEQISQSIRADKLDKQLLLSMVNEHTDAVKQAAPAVVDKLAAFHASLTPEQRTKLAEHLETFRQGGKFCGRHRNTEG